MDNQIPVQTEQPWKPAANPWLIAAGVMFATFMEVLDTSVANVSLTHIAGSLSVSNDEATWVLTSYLVSNAVILPTSSWFSRRFGRRRFLITCITIITLASLLCGLATSLGFLILVFRRANNYTYAHAAFFRRFLGFVHPGEISSSR